MGALPHILHYPCQSTSSSLPPPSMGSLHPRGRFGSLTLKAFLKAQTFGWYWRARGVSTRLMFRAGVSAALARTRLRRARTNVRTVRALARRAVPTTAAAAAAVAGAAWLDGEPWTPDLPATPSASVLYGTLAGFAGVFLGIYYAALGVVVEQVYAAGSRALRKLVLAGRVEDVYVWMVVFLGVTNVLLLAVEAAGRPTGVASVGLVTLAGAVALVGARGLMTSGLRYFDPAVLAGEARLEAERLYDLVADAPSGKVATAAARVGAETQLSVLVELSDSGDEVIRICGSVLSPEKAQRIHAVLTDLPTPEPVADTA